MFAVFIPVYEDFLQTGVDEVRHQGGVVPADSLNAFAVHLVVCVCTGGEIQAGVALLVDEQVRIINLQKHN